MSKNILLLTLRTFSATGGIEKVCRILGKALHEHAVENHGRFEMASMYDTDNDAAGNEYFPQLCFSGFGLARIKFIRQMVRKGAKNDVVILSHINLLLVGWLIKKWSPSTKVILLAHGIEIWEPLPAHKRKMLNACDQLWCVSSFTRDKIISVHNIAAQKCLVLNNCLDPFLPLPSGSKKNAALLSRYGFSSDDKILMTLTRLSSAEQYKGYDKVIDAMALLRNQLPGLKYLLAGSYDATEKKRLDELIAKHQLQEAVVMTGFVPDDELVAHFELADVYIMPSSGEGFGIVFIEAMFYGLLVIGGNKDGSTDALLHGELGVLTDPFDTTRIKEAILEAINSPISISRQQGLLNENFSYEVYKQKLRKLLEHSA